MLSFSSVITFLLCIFGVIVASTAQTRSSYSLNKDKLINDLLRKAPSDVHPDGNSIGQIDVRVDYKPIYLDIDEQSSIVSVHGWFGMFWRDRRLKFDPSQYSDIKIAYLDPKKVWHPDFRVYNSMKHEDYETTDVIAHNNGWCFWVPPMTTYTYCKLDFTYWPWDIQNCVITHGSWTRSGWELDIFNMNGKNISDVDTNNYQQNKWQIIKGINFKYIWGEYEKENKYFWSAIKQRLSLKRVAGIDRKLAVFPLLVITCLTLATFWTFPAARSRLILGSVNFLVCIIFLLFLRTRLPVTGSQIPMIVSFAGSITVLVMVQIIAALAVANLISRSDQPPLCIISPLEGMLGKVLCLSNVPLFGQIPPGMPGYSIDVEAFCNEVTSNKPNSEDQTKNTSNNSTKVPSKPNSDWNLLTQAIDRILFIFYLLIILIFLAAYVGGIANTDVSNKDLSESGFNA